MNASIVMASYNGGKYIKDQLDSIVKQMNPDDELVISDDGSDDKTIEIIQQYEDKYRNVKLVKGQHKGISENFNNAILNSSNELVFLSDQDDVWRIDKLASIKKEFEKNRNVNVIMHNALYCDSKGEPINMPDLFMLRRTKNGFIRNLAKSTYYGCCMAIRRNYLSKIMPLPSNVPYDQYIGICAEYDKCALLIAQELIYHREHDNNVSTSHHELLNMVKIRLELLKSFNQYRKRERK